MISSNVRILQVNLNRNQPATESALQVAIELKVDLVLVQEPWVLSDTQDYAGARSTLHSSFVQILPRHKTLRPRTLVLLLLISYTYELLL